MTKITIDRRDWQIIADGHAGAMCAEGVDPVCCAVSTLMQTMLYTLRFMGYGMEHEVQDGYLRVTHVRGSGPITRELMTVYTTIGKGLEMIAEAYPEHVQVRHVY